jgi:PAS domain S-box-containing protein
LSYSPVTPDFLAGGGELGALIRAFDWASTPLGPAEAWPQSLRIAVRIMLASRQPIWIGWGPELTYLYNDAYKSIIGGKHPWALGRPVSEVWAEISHEIAPMLATAMRGDQGTYVEAQLLIMERNGYPEETYYTFSYSPVPDDVGSVGGIICANSDDTQRVIGERQLALLRELAAGTANARSWREVCERSTEALRSDPRDLPFALLYVAEPETQTLSLVGLSGIERNHPAAPEKVSIDDNLVWPFEEAMRQHELRIVPDLGSRFGRALPTGPWSKPPSKAALLPIMPTGETGRAGVLIVGLNPFRLLDDGYRGFLGLVAGQIAAAIANAQAYEEERRRAEALAEIDRAKTTFFSNISHEFRTPLTLMLGPLEDALNHPDGLPELQRGRIEVAYRNSLRLLKLVNSLLDFARIEAGRVQASFEPTDLAAMTADLASSFRAATEKAGLRLVIHCAELHRPVYVDRSMWEKIVLNLLSNAFKFTFNGEIAISLRARTDGSAVELAVRDTGVGVPEHELPRLFERFHRVEGQRSRSFEGSGIGLALVQELVKLHHGTIRVESEVGRGTEFVVSVPFGTAHLPEGRIGAELTVASTSLRAEAYVEEALRWIPDQPFSGTETADRAEDIPELPLPAVSSEARILVADDNSDMRNYIRRLLGARWEVEAVSDGLAALVSLRARKPDLLLTDVMMPQLDGFELLRAVRGDPDLRDLPVLVLSARAGEEARVEGIAAGADDYVTKPFSARELIARVNTNLELARIRRNAMRELRESEARFRNMADSAPVMMWVTDGDGRCTYLNRGWCEFTGQTLEMGLGFGWLDVTHPEDRHRADSEFQSALKGRRAFRLEYRLRRHDGAYRWAIDAAVPRISDDGTVLGYIGSVIDITERKEAEQVLQQLNTALEARVANAVAERAEAEAQLRQAQKMEAVGRLTGGVAHDFNNVLQVIGGNLQLLSKDLAGNARAEHRLLTALAGVARGSKLASQLLAFGRRQPLAPKVVSLGRLVRGVDDMLRRALGDGIEIECVIGGGLWNTFVDVVQVENALLNLAINARDAMDGHGKLTIEAGNAYLDEAYAARHPDVSAGQYVMLAVTDTGCGIPTELLERVFEPFFTTKPEGAGTGLGLSMVYGFVKQSGGHVKIYSEVGQGTTVRLYLPRSREQEDVPVEVDMGPPAGGTETVLVVEDDDDVRSTVVELLAELGYRVLKARDAQNALAIIESGISMDVLFTDVVMPGPLRSPELARKARERLPEIAVLFTSGYTENAVVHGGRLDDGIELLSKPYSREALARKLRQVIANRRLPPHHPAAPVTAPERVAYPAAALQPLRILLVEDEALIRHTTADMLTRLGHLVLQAPSAEAAWAAMSGQNIDLLLADVGLPGTSGLELAAQISRDYPDIQIVFVSGYDVVPQGPPGSSLARAAVLRKPYSEEELVGALRAALS